MCEGQEIRYVHYMTHSEYPEQLACGCVCAGNMEGDDERAKSRERRLQSVAKSRAAWLGRQWRISQKGNPFLNARGYNVAIFQKRDTAGAVTWGFSVKHKATEKTFFSIRSYESERAARMGAFDGMFWLINGGT